MSISTKYIIDPVAREILEFWFEPSTKNKWWAKDAKFDKLIIDKYENIYIKAQNGNYDHFVEIPEEILALIIIFDQFPRNMYRGTPKAFQSDSEALELTKHAIAYKMDFKLISKDFRQFLYMPLMHSEDKNDQVLAIEKFATINKDSLHFAKLHKDIIDRFGRFPHRNNILGRKSTSEEIEFLKQPNSSF